jgi:L-fuculose-phosphate aldolase
MNWELPAVHYMVGVSGNKVPLAKYAPAGTQELSDHLLEAIGDFNACLLANHGLVTVGADIQSAFNVAEQLELVAKIFICCKSMGEPAILSDDDMQFMVEKLRSYGQPK